MKTFSALFAVSSAMLIFTFAARAQDSSATGGDPNAGAPPPMDQSATGGDQGVPAPPPPPDQGGAYEAQQAPPPDQGQGGDQGGDQGASFQDFYNQLSSQGQWVQTDNYGYAFQPTVSDPNWAPYTDGHWVYTDDGWTWDSEEPWGWATYHYGRWVNIDGTGWCWVPGYRWAPAWVSWRYGGGYCGWAPLPPESFVGVDYAQPGVNIAAVFHFGGDVDVNFGIGPGCYNFVPVAYMGEPNYRHYYIDRSRNFVVINNTTNITNITIGGAHRAGNFQHITAFGPPISRINAQAQTHIQNVRLTSQAHPGRASLSGGSLAVYAPRVNPATSREARPAHVAATIAHPTFNRGNSITRPLAVNARIEPRAPSAEAVQAAEAARQHAPATAKIANENATVKAPLSHPLTSLQPVNESHVSHTPAASTTGGYHPEAATTTTHAATPTHESTPSHYTGEPVHPATTYHPPAETAPAESHTPAAPIYHPEQTPPVTHTQEPAPIYHQETAPTYHPQEPAPAYHQEAAPTYHTQQAPPVTHTQQAAPAESHSGGGGGGGGGHSSEPPPSHAAAAAPASHSSGQAGGQQQGNGNGH